MSFKCNSCGKTISESKAAGIVIGNAARATIKSYTGVDPAGPSDFTREVANELTTGMLSALNVRCPSCNSKDWS